MRGMTLVVLLGLLLIPLTASACPSGKHADRVPVTLFEHCLEKDLKAGLVQHVSITERDVRWFVKGSPEIRVERVRLAADEVSRVRRLSEWVKGCPARSFTLNVARAERTDKGTTAQLSGYLALLAFFLAVLVWSARRSRTRVRVLTRQVERREAWVLVYTTLTVVAFVVAMWPDRQTSTVQRLEHRVRANLVYDVTLTNDSVTWKEAGRRTTYTAPLAGDAESDRLYKSLRGAVVHARNPDRPNEVLHRMAVRRDTSRATLALGLMPWLIAGMFWCAWVRMIRKSCCW